MHPSSPTPPRAGFTVIELLVVVLIIAVLALWLIWPCFSHGDKARQVTCMGHQRQINLALSLYAQDHQGMLPKSPAVWPSLKLDKDILVCPTAGKRIPNGYAYSATAAGKSSKQFADPVAVLLTCDGTPTRHGLPNICYGKGDIAWRHPWGKNKAAVGTFLDGHAEIITSANPAWFKPVMKKQEK